MFCAAQHQSREINMTDVSQCFLHIGVTLIGEVRINHCLILAEIKGCHVGKYMLAIYKLLSANFV